MAVFLRIEGQREVLIGEVRSMAGMARLLYRIADAWQRAVDEDKLYEPSP